MNNLAPCRLLLALPHRDAGAAAAYLAQVLDSGKIGCVLLRCDATGRCDAEHGRRLAELCAAADTAFVVEEDVSCAVSIGADGVQVTGTQSNYDAARSSLGRDGIVGVSCADERHTALSLAEQGADYVVFGAASGSQSGARDALVSWWAEIVEVPVVAWSRSGPDDVSALVALGADFVAVELSSWDSAQVVNDAFQHLSRALPRPRSAA